MKRLFIDTDGVSLGSGSSLGGNTDSQALDPRLFYLQKIIYNTRAAILYCVPGK